MEKNEQTDKIQAVMFVQHTPYSEMAKRMREKLNSLEKLGKFKIKIVERAGNKLVDVLHKSNAWGEKDCERIDCLICNTSNAKKGSCRKRNVLYETYCITCEKDAKKKREKEEGDEEYILNILERDHQAKNPSVITKMDGANDANDTPVFVEAEARSNREVVKIPSGNSSPSINSIQSNPIEVTLDKENQYKNLEVVPIPDGNYSRDKDNIQRDSPQITCPGIYKKGACPPPHREKYRRGRKYSNE